MIDRGTQIAEMAKDVTGSIVWCSLEDDFLTVDGFRTAEALYEMGYRKQDEGEWEERIFIIFDTEKVGYRCPKCNTTWDTKTNYCPYCGAKMKGGE